MSDDPKKRPEDEAEDPAEARTIWGEQNRDPTSATNPIIDPDEDLDPFDDPAEARTMISGEDPLRNLHLDDDDEGETLVSRLEATVPFGQSAKLGNVPEIDGFTIFDKLGEGGMGVVWKAIQLSTNREVALKLLPPAAIGSEKAQIRFQREVETAASLEHPNIASIYDSGLNKGIFFYAMQSIDGIELNSYVKAKELPEKETIALMIKLSEAVHFAHLNGIVHRDLKPGNVLVTKAEGEPKILDFGLAKSFTGDDPQNDVSIAGEIVGTPMYMSTEQARGEVENIDGRTDVYALGVMLFELITKGQFPYSREGGPYDIIRRKFTDQPTRPRTIDPKINIDLEAVILKAIEADAEKRYQSAELLAQDLEHYLSGQPVSARRHTTTYITGKWMRRNRFGIAAVVSLIIAAAGFSVYKDWVASKEVDNLAAVKIAGVEKKSAEELAASEAEKNRLALEKQVAIDEATRMATNTRSHFTSRIAALTQSMDEGNTVAAISQLKGIDQQSSSEDGAKFLAEFSRQIEPLRKRLATMRASDSERQQAIVTASAAFQSLGENQIAAEADLNDNLLNELDSLASKHQDVLAENEVKARLDQVAQKIKVFALKIIEDRSDIEQRPTRLQQLRKFLTSSRFTGVYPALSTSLQTRLSEAEHLHAFNLINRANQPIRVTQTETQAVFDLQPDEQKPYALAFAEPALFQFSSVMLDPEGKAADPYFLSKAAELTPVKAGGSNLELKDFTRKKIPFTAQTELPDLTLRHSAKEKGPWETFAPDGVVLPGPRFIRYDRPDYQSFTNEVVVKVEETAHRVTLPADLDWSRLRRPHLLAFEQAREKAQAGDNLAALALAEGLVSNDFGSPTLRDQLASFIREQQSHPRVVLAEQLPAAEAAIDDFVTAFIQRDNPLGSKIKPYRFLQGDLPVPALALPNFPADRLALLSANDRERYTCVMTWQKLLQPFDPANLDAERRRLAGPLDAAAAGKATLGNHLRAQTAVLRRTKNSQVPNAGELALNDPLTHQWLAHARFAMKSLDSDASLSSWENFLSAGGKPDHFDTAVALYAGYVLINDVVEGLVHSGVGPTHRNWVNDAAGMLSAAEKLGVFIQAVPLSELKTAMQRVESNSKSDNDQIDLVIAHILSECLERGDPKETFAASVLSRRKNELTLSPSQKVELNGRLNTMKF
ncbi:MAG: serine/threonine protein kinase [Candidatus Omnitrophota bacterium]|jgi:serine/threonine protein kinase